MLKTSASEALLFSFTKLTTRSDATSELDELLDQVFAGKYENFRTYLQKNDIKELKLRDKNLGSKVLTHLFLALQGTPVTKIDLSINNISAENVKQFAQSKYLKKTNIIHLKINHNMIGLKGAMILVQSCIGTAVKYLDLSFCGMGMIVRQKGANKLKAFSKLVSKTNLTHLNLAGNALANEGAAQVLSHLGKTVTHLDLSHNLIHFNFELDFKKTNLKSLRLCYNGMLPSDGARLARCLAGSHLKFIDISGNKLGTRGALDFIKMSNPHLRKIYLNGNQITEEIVDGILDWLPYTYFYHLQLNLNNIKQESIDKLQNRMEQRCQYLLLVFCLVQLKFLPLENKKAYLPDQKQPDKCNIANKEDHLGYAAGIIMHPALPDEIFCRIVSFLPYADAKREEKQVLQLLHSVEQNHFQPKALR